jgi:uncharacterized membrane protein
MPVLLPVHIVAGGVALVAGFVALYTRKGGTRHRKSGMVFVYAMIAMALLGSVIAAFFRPNPGNVVAGLLTAYLVATALTTVRTQGPWSRHLDAILMMWGWAVGLTAATFAFQASASATGKKAGIPAAAFFMFAMAGLAASAGDLRRMWAGRSTGAARLTRHLWRMCFALFIAASSFFFGQAKVIPRPIRIPGLLALPVLAVVVTTLYWLWRVRSWPSRAGTSPRSARMRQEAREAHQLVEHGLQM